MKTDKYREMYSNSIKNDSPKLRAIILSIMFCYYFRIKSEKMKAQFLNNLDNL